MSGRQSALTVILNSDGGWYAAPAVGGQSRMRCFLSPLSYKLRCLAPPLTTFACLCKRGEMLEIFRRSGSALALAL